jgi:hypothetical protein
MMAAINSRDGGDVTPVHRPLNNGLRGLRVKHGSVTINPGIDDHSNVTIRAGYYYKTTSGK